MSQQYPPQYPPSQQYYPPQQPQYYPPPPTAGVYSGGQYSQPSQPQPPTYEHNYGQEHQYGQSSSVAEKWNTKPRVQGTLFVLYSLYVRIFVNSFNLKNYFRLKKETLN